MKTTRYPNRKVLPVGREGLEEGVEIIGDLVLALKNTMNFGISVFTPFDLYLSSVASIMFCTEIKVLGPVEQPKSATHTEFREAERVLMSK